MDIFKILLHLKTKLKEKEMCIVWDRLHVTEKSWLYC